MHIRGPAGLPGEVPTSVVADGRGRYWLFFFTAPPRIFDAAGRLNGELAPAANGPRDFVGLTRGFHIPGDSVGVIDYENRRIAVVAPDLRVTRRIAVPSRLYEPRVLKWPSRVLFVGSISVDRSKARPIHELDLSGSTAALKTSLGTVRTDYDHNSFFGFLERTARTSSTPRNGSVWEAELGRYRLYRWSVAGAMTESLERQPSWFPREPPAHYRSTVPQPRIEHVEQDAQGLLWVFVHVAAGTFESAMRKPQPGVPTHFATRYHPDKLYRTMIEVIDPVRSRVIARHTVAAPIAAVLPGGRAAFYAVDPEDGRPALDIVSLRLTDK